MTAPRFGLDLERQGALTSWDELAWTDFDVGGRAHRTRADRVARFAGVRRSGLGPQRRAFGCRGSSRPYRRLYPAGVLDQPMSTDPLPPPPPPVDPPQIDPAIRFTLLDPELPLALFPVRLEARFLPENQPTEIVVRVFPDEIHVDAHDL